MKLPFLGPSGEGYSPNIDPSRTVNMYPVIDKAGGQKSDVVLVATPGTALVNTFGEGPHRAAYVYDNTVFVVSGNKVYSAVPYVADSIGEIETIRGPVSVADNGVSYWGMQAAGTYGWIGGDQMMLVDGESGYIYNRSTKVFEKITDSSFPTNPNAVTFLDGYFVVTNNTMSHYVSELYNGLSWNGMASSPLTANPDPINTVKTFQNQLYFLKNYNSEIWYDAGTPTSQGTPFRRVSGGVLDIGTNAPDAVVAGAGSLWFPAFQRSGEEGEFIGVVGMSGGNFAIISTPGITYRISKCTISDAVAYMYADGGHIFYVITFPTDSLTLVYDITTNMWHDRSSPEYTDPLIGFPRHISNTYATLGGKHYIGDWNSGKLLEMSDAYYTEAGNLIKCTRIAGHLFNPDHAGKNIFMRRFFLDAEVGTADMDIESTVEPKAVLSWSNDYGRSWSNQYECSMGTLGNYRQRLEWRRIGCGWDYVFRVDITAATRKVLLGAYGVIGR